MERSGQTLTAFLWACWRLKQHWRSTYLCCGTLLQLDCWWIYVCVCVSVCVVSESLPDRVSSDLNESVFGHDWPLGWVAGGERGTLVASSIISLGSCSGGGLAGRTAAESGSRWTCWLSQDHQLSCHLSSSIVTQTETFQVNHSIFHSQTSRHEANLAKQCFVIGPKTPSKAVDQILPPWCDGAREDPGLHVYCVSWTCLVAPVGLAGWMKICPHWYLIA